MTYSGAIVRQQAADARQLHTPDPMHGQASEDPYAQKWTSPPGTTPDMGGTDFPVVVTNTPGLVLGHFDNSHDSDGDFHSYGNQAEWTAGMAESHSDDTHASWLESNGAYYPAPLQDAQTTYHADQLEMWGSPAPNPVVLERGRNSLAANNPERDGYDPGGFRWGFWRWKHVWRDRQQNLLRTYDLQPVWDRNITTQGNTPVPDDAPYWALFGDSMARGYTRNIQQPAQARGAIDMYEMDTATAVDYSGTSPDSIIGTGF